MEYGKTQKQKLPNTIIQKHIKCITSTANQRKQRGERKEKQTKDKQKNQNCRRLRQIHNFPTCVNVC